MGGPIGEAGLSLIKNWEGCRLTAYKPVETEAYWTIGWGHYGPDVRKGQTITQEEADKLLVIDCQRFADAVDNPYNVPLTAQLNANQRDALISFAFNCGEGNLRKLCKGRTLEQICEAMSLYTMAGGKSLVGLERRRAAEQRLFDTPVKEVATVPVDNNIPDSYALEAVEWAKANGILRGDAQGNLNLHLPCSRQHVLVWLWRFAKLIGKA